MSAADPGGIKYEKLQTENLHKAMKYFRTNPDQVLLLQEENYQ
jgi:hypothetical protein